MNLGEGDTLIAIARNAEAGDSTDEVNTDVDAVAENEESSEES